MKLVLLNRALWFENTLDDLTMKYDTENEIISEDEVTWSEGKKTVARKLISELFKGKVSELKVKLRHEGNGGSGWPEEPEYRLTLKHVAEDNILKNLYDRFQDNVTISVCIGMDECEERDDPSTLEEENSTGEMTIDECLYRCEGLVEIYERRLSFCDGCYGWVTITANISLSDDEINEILASSPVPPLSKKVLEQALFHDVTISARDGVQIGAHKCFLSAASPVLRAQFGNNWEKEAQGKLNLSDVSEKGVKAFLHYVYYQDLEEAKEDPEVAFELLGVAHKYEVVPLELWLIAHFRQMKDEDITVGLAFTMYAFVRNIESAKRLKLKTVRILNSNIDEMENLSQYKDLMEQNPEFVKELRMEFANAAKGKGIKRKLGNK